MICPVDIKTSSASSHHFFIGYGTQTSYQKDEAALVADKDCFVGAACIVTAVRRNLVETEGIPADSTIFTERGCGRH